MPVVLAGRGGGTIQGGRYHDLSADPNRKLCRLHLALMDRMGVHVDSLRGRRKRWRFDEDFIFGTQPVAICHHLRK
ncbi:MAG: hypothetical protein R3F31_19240 [Verrucomicrobiales bacterium]